MKLPLHCTKPEKSSLLKEKNTKGIIINGKGTRKVKDGEDKIKNLRNLGYTSQTVTDLL